MKRTRAMIRSATAPGTYLGREVSIVDARGRRRY